MGRRRFARPAGARSRAQSQSPLRLKDEIMAISRRAAALPRRTGRTPEDIIGYDERGAPR